MVLTGKNVMKLHAVIEFVFRNVLLADPNSAREITQKI